MNIKSRVEEFAWPIVEEMGYIYVDTEYKKQGPDYVLTLFIDKKGGVSLDDCEEVSRKIEEELDKKDFIDGSYYLCVSSPGLDRPLKTSRDFERVMGELIEVRLYQSFQGEKVFVGTLTEYTDDNITIETEEEEIIFELPEMAKVSRHIEI